MTDKVENLVLEHLRALRNEVKGLSTKVDEQFETLRLRLGSVEAHLANLSKEVAGIHSDIAILHVRIDKLEIRLDRIDRRLELREEV